MNYSDIQFTVSHSTDIQCERIGQCISSEKILLLNEYLFMFAFIYVADGSLAVTVNGKGVSLDAGNLYFIQPDTALSFVRAQERTQYYFCTFDGNIPRRYFLFGKSVKSVSLTESRKTAIKDAVGSVSNQNFYNELKIISFIIDSLKEFDSVTEPESNYVGAKDVIDQFIDEVCSRYMEKITVGEICRKIGISVNYFTTYFTNRVKISPRQFIINFRINKAKEMLTETNLSISEIAQYIGYDDAFTFSRIFKKKVGVSPTVYCKNQKKQIIDIKGYLEK